MLLDTVKSPAELRKLSPDQLETLCAEIRSEIVAGVAANGGHLASSLGALELTVALHYAFDTPHDKLIFDVGHQAYAHKILTGRRNAFRRLRHSDGCSGFPSPAESEYDALSCGHAGTAISGALGLAISAKLAHRKEYDVAVVGDGALNCGLSLEALNHIRESGTCPIIVLNDNKMSIETNVGAIPRYLNQIISGRAYNRFKALSKMMLRKIPGHQDIRRTIQKLEEATKSMFLPGVFFEELGIRYFGPVDGHNIPELLRFLEAAKRSHRPVVIHAVTEKGHGYPPAAADPEHFHGVGKFDAGTGNSERSATPGFSAAFGSSMCELAERRKDLVAITAAMTSGTGLEEFSRRYPRRMIDVGIAEGHAVALSAGLAAGGMRPVVAVYSTFIQRALDNIYHDVCLPGFPVIFALDRAGAVDDGPTHHGIYELGFLREMPNLAIMAPADENELRSMLSGSLELDTPAVIRYPRGASGVPFDPAAPLRDFAFGKAEVLREGGDLAIWALGEEAHRARKIADILSAEYGLNAAVVNARFVKPLDSELLRAQAAKMPVFTLENHCVSGGLGAAAAAELNDSAALKKCFGWPEKLDRHGPVDELRKDRSLDDGSVASAIASALQD